MRNDTSERIIEYIGSKGEVSAKDLGDYIGISRQGLYRQINNLLEKGAIYKIGKPPKVFYLLKNKPFVAGAFFVEEKIKAKIEKNYLIITPTGEKMEGWEGFIYWCQKTKQDVAKVSKEYIAILEKYNQFRKNGLIDGLGKIKTTFEKVFLDKLFYVDFYSLERFGKTKLGQLLLYAKQSQDKKMIKKLIEEINPRISFLLKKYKIDAVGFIPPTVKREVQFMKELERNTNILKAQKISLLKIKTEVAIPQKTLNKLADRMENAKKTILADEKAQYGNILLIDDAVGSGATLNETAGQLKRKKICRGKIVGLSITGSAKGFDVISEV